MDPDRRHLGGRPPSAGLVLDNGRVCVLLGTRGPLEEVVLPNGSIRFVTATLLSRGDYDAVMAGGDAKRQELAASLAWRS